MIAERELVLERPTSPPAPQAAPQVRQRDVRVPATSSSEPGLGWRILMVVIGFDLAVLGWSLVMTVLLAFLGLPLFIFGLALMQAQQR